MNAIVRPHQAGAASAVRANLVSALVVAVVATVFVVQAVHAGLPVRSALLGIVMVGLTQVVPGALVWRAVRPREGWLLEDLAAGFAIGAAMAVPVQIVAGLTQQRWLATALPLALAVTLLAVPLTRRRIVEATWVTIAWWFAPVVGLTTLVGLRQLDAYYVRNRVSYPFPAAANIDTYLHQALASQLLTRGPGSWPTVAGEELGYHWFTHAWLAHVSAVSGLELNEVLVRLAPALMPLAVALAVGVTALRLSGRSWVGAVAAFIAMAGDRYNPFGSLDLTLPMTPESPTLALGAPTLLLLVTVLALRWRGEALSGTWLLVPLLAVVAAGTKGSTSPLVVAGLALAAVAMLLWNRPLVRPVLVDLLVVAAGLGFAVVFVFLGSSAGLQLDLLAAGSRTYLGVVMGAGLTVPMTVAAIALTVIGGMSRAALALTLPFFSDTRRDPTTWLLIGAAMAGAFGQAIFAHPGGSQGYFYLTAIPLAAVGSALGVARLREHLGTRRLAMMVGVGLAVGAALHFLPATIGPPRPRTPDLAWQMIALSLTVVVATAVVGALLARRGGRLAGARTLVLLSLLLSGVVTVAHAYALPPGAPSGPVTTAFPTAVSQGQIDVARYIRDHSEVGDLVATNRHCTYPRDAFAVCDSRRWVVTAFSERQALVEGWTATPRATEIAPNGRDSITVPYWKPDLLRLNDDFSRAPTAQAHQALWDLGVRWYYVENTRPHADSLEPYATKRFATADATAWQLNPPPR